MFWRKKRPTETELFLYESDCRREFARVRPPEAMPVGAEIDGRPVRVLDLSAGGMACLAEGLQTGQVPLVRLRLSGEAREVAGRFQTLGADPGGVSHGRFLDLTPEMVEALHHYVLRVQKENLRRKPIETN